MTKRRQYDLMVIGAEPAGLAAAACAARGHARAGLIRTGDKPPRSASAPGVPDFVWRKLNLQDSGLEAEPVTARISLFEGGRTLRTFASGKKSGDALEAAKNPDHRLWADFNDALARAWKESEGAVRRAAARGPGKSAPALLLTLAGKGGAGAAERLTATSLSVLDDYFASDDLKIHLASVALAPLGFGGDEAGSALALAAIAAPSAWRVRASRKGPKLERVLEEAAINAGVDLIDARIRSIAAVDDKVFEIALHDGEVLRARRVMAASAEAAARAGLAVAPAFSPLMRRDGAIANVRLRFAKPVAAPGGEEGAIFYLADSLAAFAEARDAALEGRLSERAPISFEVNKDEILVQAPFCPAALKSEGEERDWTEQDRQAFGQQIVARLAPHLNGAARSVRRVDVRVTPAAPAQGDSAGIVAPPPGLDPIGAAVKLALDLIGGE
jgi:phytoene dehydrogenase-like protein